MDSSLANFELTSSTVKIDSNGSSDKSDNFEELDDVSSSGSNNDFDNNMPETVSLLIHPQTKAKVYVVGTAHFSIESNNDVAKVMRAVQPNIVILELCASRLGILSLSEEALLEEAKNFNFSKFRETVRENGLYYGIIHLLFLQLSAHFAKEMGMAPGGEFRVAYKEASEIPHCIIQLGDRPITITILRALTKLSWLQTLKLTWQILFRRDKISKEEVEECKKEDIVSKLLEEFAEEFPCLLEVFVAERDIFLTNSLQQAAKVDKAKIGLSHNETLKIVGVVGMGHMIGIKRHFNEDQLHRLPELLYVPPQSLSTKIIRVGFKLTIVTLGCMLIYRYVPVPRSIKLSTLAIADRISSGIHNNMTFMHVKITDIHRSVSNRF